jgi:hypothetical protein
MSAENNRVDGHANNRLQDQSVPVPVTGASSEVADAAEILDGRVGLAVMRLVFVADHLKMLAEDFNHHILAERTAESFQGEAHNLALELDHDMKQFLVAWAAADRVQILRCIEELNNAIGDAIVKMTFAADHLMMLADGLNQHAQASTIANRCRVETYHLSTLLGDGMKALFAAWRNWNQALPALAA